MERVRSSSRHVVGLRDRSHLEVGRLTCSAHQGDAATAHMPCTPGCCCCSSAPRTSGEQAALVFVPTSGTESMVLSAHGRILSRHSQRCVLLRYLGENHHWRRRDTIVTPAATQSERLLPCGHSCCFAQEQHRPSLRICRHRHPTLLPDDIVSGGGIRAARHPRATHLNPLHPSAN